MTYKGIIIRCSQYKDYDGMINLLTEDGLIPFKARNVFKFDNKNNILSSLLLYGNFTFSDNKDKFLLFKEVESIFDSRKYINDIKILAFLNIINELVINLLDEEDLKNIYDELKYVLENINSIDLNLSITYIISKILIITGYGLNVSGYNNKNNISFDFNNGRFISSYDYNQNQNRKYNDFQKRILFESFNKDISNVKNNTYKSDDIKSVNNDLINYINSCFGIALKSTKMIEKVL